MVCMLCENEGVKEGIYRRGGREGSVMYGWVWVESGLNLNGEVGGVL